MFDAEVKTTEPVTVAFITMRGSYSQLPEALGRVYGWIAQHGLQPVGMPGAVYFTDPSEGSEDDAVWEVRAPVAGEPDEATADESGCGVKRIGAQKVVSVMYKGPYEEVAPTYEALAAWVAGNGMEMAGPPEEYYYSDPADTPPEDYLTEIRFPVA